ncbi:uncharacterized protein BDZ83DRAFT_747680 [Colletotrichum acutatum]|uniref:Uncharacterized protein n=1 Tax=Glomerella acutata TaxID=27357 RepID=A0AAD9D0L1_GLOAC|nr:uncharacterized protein BDZ83DRAFT_747680 [Colletotrichum acutatum]KAK1730043.1 hypothetical protein BDZ83DRAFT_747680 [Colletotrichum acutatum]
MSCSHDNLRADIRQYGPGKKLTLFPHSPPDPHGRSTYKHNDPANNLGVEIIERLSNGSDGDNQVLLVRVFHKPVTDLKFTVPDTQEIVVVKIFDPLFNPEDAEEGPWKVASRADMKLSREAGAYKELHKNNLTGYPRLAPQYCGCWTTRLMSYSPDFEGVTRHVGLVLLEYI